MVFKKIVKKVLSKSPSLYASAQNFKFDQEHRQDFSKFTGKEKELLTEIHSNGFAIIPDFFNTDLCNACINDMNLMFENHPEFIHKKEDLRIFGSEELSDNIKIFSNNSLLDNIANGYNAVATVCGFTLANKIDSAPQEYGSGGPWHRDSFFRQFKSIIYLNDVNEQNGPFQLISKSHIPKIKTEDKKKFNLEEMQALFNQELVEKILEDNPNRLKTITGKAGTALIVDTSIIHRGMPLQNGIRYALTNYYFEKNQINQHLVDHFSPLTSPKKVLNLAH